MKNITQSKMTINDVNIYKLYQICCKLNWQKRVLNIPDCCQWNDSQKYRDVLVDPSPGCETHSIRPVSFCTIFDKHTLLHCKTTEIWPRNLNRHQFARTFSSQSYIMWCTAGSEGMKRVGLEHWLGMWSALWCLGWSPNTNFIDAIGTRYSHCGIQRWHTAS